MPLQNSTMYHSNPNQKDEGGYSTYEAFAYHKDIYFRGHHHYAMYQGDQLLWTCFPNALMPSASLYDQDWVINPAKGINRFGFYGLQKYTGILRNGLPSQISRSSGEPFYYTSKDTKNATFIKEYDTDDDPENYQVGNIPYALVKWYGTDGLLFFVPRAFNSFGDQLNLARITNGTLTFLRPGGFDTLEDNQYSSFNSNTFGSSSAIILDKCAVISTYQGQCMFAYAAYSRSDGAYNCGYCRYWIASFRNFTFQVSDSKNIIEYAYSAISKISPVSRIGLKVASLESYVSKAIVVGDHLIYLGYKGTYGIIAQNQSAGLILKNSRRGNETDLQYYWRAYPGSAISDCIDLTMPLYDLDRYLIMTNWRNSIYHRTGPLQQGYMYGFATQYATDSDTYDGKFLLYRMDDMYEDLDSPVEIVFPIATGGRMTLGYSGIQYIEPMVYEDRGDYKARFYLIGQFKILPEDTDKGTLRLQDAYDNWYTEHFDQGWYFIETDENFTVLHHEWLGVQLFSTSTIGNNYAVYSPWTTSFTLIHGIDGESVYKIYRYSYLLGHKLYRGGSASNIRKYSTHVSFYNGAIHPTTDKKYIVCWGSQSGTGEFERGYIYNVNGKNPDPILRDVEDLRFVPLAYEKYDMLREGWYEGDDGHYHYDPDHDKEQETGED